MHNPHYWFPWQHTQRHRPLSAIPSQTAPGPSHVKHSSRRSHSHSVWLSYNDDRRAAQVGHTRLPSPV